MTYLCDACETPVPPRPGPGRPKRWCSAACRQRVHRWRVGAAWTRAQLQVWDSYGDRYHRGLAVEGRRRLAVAGVEVPPRPPPLAWRVWRREGSVWQVPRCADCGEVEAAALVELADVDYGFLCEPCAGGFVDEFGGEIVKVGWE